MLTKTLIVEHNTIEIYLNVQNIIQDIKLKCNVILIKPFFFFS